MVCPGRRHCIEHGTLRGAGTSSKDRPPWCGPEVVRRIQKAQGGRIPRSQRARLRARRPRTLRCRAIQERHKAAHVLKHLFSALARLLRSLCTAQCATLTTVGELPCQVWRKRVVARIRGKTRRDLIAPGQKRPKPTCLRVLVEAILHCSICLATEAVLRLRGRWKSSAPRTDSL